MVPPSDRYEQAAGRRGHEASGFAAHGLAELDLELRADIVSASVARDELTAWLYAHGWPPARTVELVLVVSEAVSNSIEHGYGVGPETYDHPGVVRVRARIVAGRPGFRHVDLVVSDDGRWREPAARMQPGHGLYIIRSVAAELSIDGRPYGTTLRIRSQSSPVR